MKALYIPPKMKKLRCRIRLLPALVFTLLIVAGSLGRATAQRGNLSDWNVPPPLPPGSITKGNTTGRGAKGKLITLSPSDVPVPKMPGTGPVQLPLLAAISSTPLALGVDDQPVITDGNAGFLEIPLPAAPDAPAMPQRSIQDVQLPQVIDLPEPTAPELPPIPAEPISSGKIKSNRVTAPVMPDVLGAPTFSIPSGFGFYAWPIPGIPENVTVKFEAPPPPKSGRPGGKATKKIKTSKS